MDTLFTLRLLEFRMKLVNLNKRSLLLFTSITNLLFYSSVQKLRYLKYF